MIVPLLLAAAGFFAIGAIGAAMRAHWGLFFLFPSLAGVLGAPLIAGLSGVPIRGAYATESFWSAALVIGMGFGIAFAVIAVIAGRKPTAAAPAASNDP